MAARGSRLYDGINVFVSTCRMKEDLRPPDFLVPGLTAAVTFLFAIVLFFPAVAEPSSPVLLSPAPMPIGCPPFCEALRASRAERTDRNRTERGLTFVGAWTPSLLRAIEETSTLPPPTLSIPPIPKALLRLPCFCEVRSKNLGEDAERADGWTRERERLEIRRICYHHHERSQGQCYESIV